MDEGKLNLELIGPERVYYELSGVDQVVTEAEDGELGILPGHTSLLTNLRIGRCVAKLGRENRIFAVSGGLMEIKKNRIRIMTSAAEEGKDIDKEKAEKALERAKRRLESKTEDIDFARAQSAFDRAMNRLRVKKLS